MTDHPHLTLVKVQEDSFENSKAHGFWDKPDTIDTVPAKLALIHAEVSEALEEFRKGNMELYYEEFGGGFDAHILSKKPEGFGIELADVVIRVADLASHLGIDLTEMVAIKTAYNLTRPKMHGKLL